VSTERPEKPFVHHIGIVVQDLEGAVRFFQQLLGVHEVEYEELEDRGLRIALLTVSNLVLELITPTREGTAIDRFLRERGGGLHHIAVGVPNIQEAIKVFQDLGVRVVDGPRPGAFSPKVLFTHPKDTHKVLLEFMEMEPKA